MAIDFESKRIRDPVHGLIVFEENNECDALAWKLLATREMQRLRRIRQLGVSEFTFPGATHTRLAHSIGVFHCARQLVEIIEREMKRNGQDFDRDRADIAILAALLHDIGHGPFSHTFESVQKERGVAKNHEDWSAEIIRNPDGEILPILGNAKAESVASLLEAEDPEDIYHAVVSSSFDADRLDYLQRDRMMTGTGAGTIDFDWLIDNLRVAEINLAPPDADDGDDNKPVATFCFASKAMPAAEQFLLARYTLHEQVYFHKTTRCIEKMIGKLLGRIAQLAGNKTTAPKNSGLPKGHPLLCFFAKDGETVDNYLALDDTAIYGALELMIRAKDKTIEKFACLLRDRKPYKTYDLAEIGSDPGRRANRERKIDKAFAAELEDGRIIKDDAAKIGIYTEIGQDEEKIYKRLHVFDGKQAREISNLSRLVKALVPKESFIRYYFENEADRDSARRGNMKGRKA